MTAGAATLERMADGPSDPPPTNNGPWGAVTNGIAFTIAGFVLFGVGVADHLGPIQLVGALVVVGGAVTVLFALVGRNYQG